MVSDFLEILAILTYIVKIFNNIFNATTINQKSTIFMYANHTQTVLYHIVLFRLVIKGYQIASLIF